jgi:formiminoglutamase
MWKLRGEERQRHRDRRALGRRLSRSFDSRGARRLAERLAAKAVRPNVARSAVIFEPGASEVRWVLLGAPDDRGVRNNHGRPGAAGGPERFRELFYAHPMADQAPAEASLLDLGDLIPRRSLAATLDVLADSVSRVFELFPEARVLVIGGGHDLAYGEILGALKTVPDSPGESSGERRHHIVNLDAQADLRPLEGGTVITSGTPFHRLLQRCDPRLPPDSYHPFGLQRTTNSPELVRRIEEWGVDAHWLEDMPTAGEQIAALTTLLDKVSNHPWHLNVDLDGFPQDVAPGVSAPQPFGLDPNLLLALGRRPRPLKNLRTVGIYELAPRLDLGDRTARLAAKIAYHVVSLGDGGRSGNTTRSESG